MQHSGTVFLTWIEHRRTREICSRLRLELAEIITKQRGLPRYAKLGWQTIRFLARRRPKLLIVQSPSIVLATLAVMLRPSLGYVLVFDAHNEAVEPHLHPSATIRSLSYWLLRKANAVIVTNEALARVVRSHGGMPIVLTDPIPEAPPTEKAGLQGPISIVLISTFAGDEPFETVVAAARRLASDAHFYVTGNPARLTEQQRAEIPPNMTLTGFLAEQDYWNLLSSCDSIMDLTTMDNCLVCGAYEAIAVDKPLILSANAASVETFHGFGEFTDNTEAGIVDAVLRFKSRRTEIEGTFPRRKAEFERQWSGQAEALIALS
jgi:hypothetical protein